MENTVEEEITVRESESITERKRSRSLSPSDNLVPSHQRGEMRFQSIYALSNTAIAKSIERLCNWSSRKFCR